jgi:hypothetical protein
MIPKSNRLEMTFPASLTLKDDPFCQLTDPLARAVQRPKTCTISQNKIVLENFFTADIPANSLVTFGFESGLTNSEAAKDTGFFLFTTYYVDDKGDAHKIDQTNSNGIYIVKAGELKFSAAPTISSLITYAKDSVYTVQGIA